MSDLSKQASEIALKLTKAQRDGLERQPCRSWWGERPASFPHTRQTAFALWRKGLCSAPLLSTNASALTPLGLAVRRILQSQRVRP